MGTEASSPVQQEKVELHPRGLSTSSSCGSPIPLPNRKGNPGFSAAFDPLLLHTQQGRKGLVSISWLQQLTGLPWQDPPPPHQGLPRPRLPQCWTPNCCNSHLHPASPYPHTSPQCPQMCLPAALLGQPRVWHCKQATLSLLPHLIAVSNLYLISKVGSRVL